MYTVHAGGNSTDLGRVGEAASLPAARRIGREAVRTMLPNGEGTYTIRTEQGETVERGECSICSNHTWSQS
jgi:hypothetical protein